MSRFFFLLTKFLAVVFVGLVVASELVGTADHPESSSNKVALGSTPPLPLPASTTGLQPSRSLADLRL